LNDVAIVNMAIQYRPARTTKVHNLHEHKG
jgi:hypothetical protein